MKCFFLLVMLLNFTTCIALAAAKDADVLFNNGEYQAAVGEYQKLLKQTPVDQQLEIQLKIAQAQVFLFKYSEASATMAKLKIPLDAKSKRRFLLMKAEIGREFLKQYGRAVPTDVEDQNTDRTRMSVSQWRQEIRKSFESLWQMREALKAVSIQEDQDLLTLEQRDLERIPTFYDLVVDRWVEELLSRDVETDSVQAKDKVRKVLKDASLGAEPKRAVARDFWRLALEDSNQPSKLEARILNFHKLFHELKTPRGQTEAGFRLAQLLSEAKKYVEAISVCGEVERISRETIGSARCHNLALNIRAPQISMLVASPGGGPGFLPLTLDIRNVEKVFFKYYKTNPDEIKQKMIALKKGQLSNDFNSLRFISPDLVEDFFHSRKPDAVASYAPKYDHPHDQFHGQINSPKLEMGLYVIVATNEETPKLHQSLIMGTLLNVSDFQTFLSQGIEGRLEDLRPGPKALDGKGVFHLYAFDAANGEPLSMVNVTTFTNTQMEAKKTNAQGRIDAALPRGFENSYVQFDFLAQHGSSWSYPAMPSSFYYQPEPPYKILTETDRPVYRPGQKVMFKSQVLERVANRYKTAAAGTKISVTARDPNGQEIYSKAFTANEFGSAAGEFDIPIGKILGAYSLQSEVSAGPDVLQPPGNAQFQVEEYKRPEFELNLKKSELPWIYGQRTQIQGDAKYYFGGAVSQATVNYRITRQDYLPWYLGWIGWRYPHRDPEELASGQVVADAQGEFKIEFTPTLRVAEPAEKDTTTLTPMSSYQVEIKARDSGGRTLQASQTYHAGAEEFNITFEPGPGFYRENSAIEISTRILDLNEVQRSGTAEFQISELESPKYEEVKDSTDLNQIFDQAKTKAVLRHGQVVFNKQTQSQIQINSLPEGFYRLDVHMQDSRKRNVSAKLVVPVFGNLNSISKMKLPALTFVENSKVWVGDKAVIVFGAGELQGPAYAEIGQGPFISRQMKIPGHGFRKIEIPVTNDFVQGFSMKWFGVFNYQTYSDQIHVDVPAKDRKLATRVQLNPIMAPGSDQKWMLFAETENKGKISAEASVRITDRSLDYYVDSKAQSLFENLYPQITSMNTASFSHLQLSSTNLEIREGQLLDFYKRADEYKNNLELPILKINQTHFAMQDSFMLGRSVGVRMNSAQGVSLKSAMLKKSGTADLSSAAQAQTKPTRESDKMDSTSQTENSAPAALRTNRSETAFYQPQLTLKSGMAPILFKAPDQLTSWSVSGVVVTKDARVGDVSGRSVTSKDLMVQIEIPRFFREGDLGELRAIIHNETDRSLRGTADIQILAAALSAANDFSLKDLSKKFEVPAKGLVTLRWSIKAPNKVAVYKVQARLQAGALSDAEERDLPVLQSRQRLVETQMVALSGNSEKTIVMKVMKQTDPTRLHESLNLQIDPQLALTVLNSIPQLIRFPCECTDQIIDRYVPLAIMNRLFSQSPKLSEAVAKIPKRTMISPAWETPDPQHQLIQLESPWIQEARGLTTDLPVTDLLNPNLVSIEREKSLKELQARQLPSGGFPWFPQGEGDLSTTLYILDGLAELSMFGVDIPRNLVGHAMSFVMEKWRPVKTVPSNLAMKLYAAYLITSYPKELVGNVAWSTAKTWVLEAEKLSLALTPLGKAQMALTFFRLGESQKAESYLARALDGAQTDPVTGTFWAPEKISWLWYNDSLEKHAFFLRALSEMKPKDARISGMVQWLLFNRKGNQWKSPRATAAAVYALLHVMKQQGSLEKGEKFEVTWGPQREVAQVEALDWIAKPIRWHKESSEISELQAQAQIKKTGPGLAFASMTWIYSTDMVPKSAASSVLSVERQYFRRTKKAAEYHLQPLKSGEAVSVGDEIEVHLVVNAKASFEYMHLQDPHAAGFEADDLLSGYRADSILRYQETRDSLMNFFIQQVPHGEYILKYRLRPTTQGQFKIGAAVLQSMFSPEISAHSSGMIIRVNEK